MKNGDIEKYTNEYDLFKVPDSIIIDELKKVISGKDIIIGQNNSYIAELENGLIKQVEKEVKRCEYCTNTTRELQAIREKHKKFNDLVNDEVNKQVKHNNRFEGMYYKLLEENKRLNKLLLQGLKNSIK